MTSGANLLTIQKFIFLLDDFHYKEFKSHLTGTNASLPLKLAEAIRKQLPAFDSHEQLCTKIYKAAGKTEKQNFNQLSSYTFKLSANLTNNYPEYLQTNIEKIQVLVANQKLDEAKFRNEVLLEIAERTNDFPSSIFALKFMSQEARMAKDSIRSEKADIRLKEAVEDQRLFYRLLSQYRVSVETEVSPKTEEEIKQLKQYFEGFENHRCVSIRVLSQFICLNIISELNSQKFTKEDNERVKKIRKEIQNYPYVVFPFLTDLKGKLEYMILNSTFTDFFAKETEKEIKTLHQHFDSIKFWKNYLNFGELNLIAVQATGLLSKYHYQVHLADYQKIIEKNDKVLMSALIEKCRNIIVKLAHRSERPFEEISVKMLYSALLILSGGNEIARGIHELEAMLTNYQQVNFKRSTSSIFMCLIVGYFSIKDYAKCSLTYKRYLKSIKGKMLFEGNHVKIQSYYYLSQWLATGSKQYPAKLRAMLVEVGNNGSQRTIWHLIKHFNLPIEEPEGLVLDLK
jgi:hypothetical protein